MKIFHTFNTCVQNGKIRGRFGLDELGGKDQPRDGTQFPVGKEELYLNYATRDKALDQLIETDYVSSSITSKLANHQKVS